MNQQCMLASVKFMHSTDDQDLYYVNDPTIPIRLDVTKPISYACFAGKMYTHVYLYVQHESYLASSLLFQGMGEKTQYLHSGGIM